MSKYQEICTSLISEWNLNSPSAQIGLLRLITELSDKRIKQIHATNDAKYLEHTPFQLVEADDIAQTIMASFFDEKTGRKLIRFETPSQMLRRITTIICHTIQDQARIMLAEKRGIHSHIEASQRREAMINTPAYEDKSFEFDLLPSALASMDEKQKLSYRIFKMKHIDGATLEEASEHFKMNVDDVRKNLKNAVQLLTPEYSELLSF